MAKYNAPPKVIANATLVILNSNAKYSATAQQEYLRARDDYLADLSARHADVLMTAAKNAVADEVVVSDLYQLVNFIVHRNSSVIRNIFQSETAIQRCSMTLTHEDLVQSLCEVLLDRKQNKFVYTSSSNNAIAYATMVINRVVGSVIRKTGNYAVVNNHIVPTVQVSGNAINITADMYMHKGQLERFMFVKDFIKLYNERRYTELILTYQGYPITIELKRYLDRTELSTIAYNLRRHIQLHMPDIYERLSLDMYRLSKSNVIANKIIDDMLEAIFNNVYEEPAYVKTEV